MSRSQRVFVNVVFAYARSLIAAGLGLFSSRWVLSSLGAPDYGLYGLVGGILILMTFINSVLSQGVNRFLAYAIGENKENGVLEWFNTALNIYVLLPVIIVPLGWLVGWGGIEYVLKIDSARMTASYYVLGFSLVSIFFAMLAMPFLSILYAYQHIHVTSIIMLIHSVGQFMISLCLRYLSGDLLIWYSGLISLSLITMNIAYVVAACRLCKDARFRVKFWWNWGRIKELSAYVSFLVIGTLGTVIRSQVVNIALNRTFGTVANAGYSIANNLSGQMQTLSNSFLLSVSPEITRLAGVGDLSKMVKVAQRTTKLGVLLFMVIGVPLFAECEFVLKLWLKEVPYYSVLLTRFIIIIIFIYKALEGHRMALQACGKIRGQQIAELVCFGLSAVCVWVSLALTKNMFVGMMPFVGGQIVFAISIGHLGCRHLSWNLKDFWLLIGRFILCIALCASINAIIYMLLEDNLTRFFVILTTMPITVIAYFWLNVFLPNERSATVGMLKKSLGFINLI